MLPAFFARWDRASAILSLPSASSAFKDPPREIHAASVHFLGLQCRCARISAFCIRVIFNPGYSGLFRDLNPKNKAADSAREISEGVYGPRGISLLQFRDLEASLLVEDDQIIVELLQGAAVADTHKRDTRLEQVPVEQPLVVFIQRAGGFVQGVRRRGGKA